MSENSFEPVELIKDGHRFVAESPSVYVNAVYGGGYQHAPRTDPPASAPRVETASAAAESVSEESEPAAAAARKATKQ